MNAKTGERTQKTALQKQCRVLCVYQTARSTLLERRHLVQAYTWHGVPLTTALTRFTLGFQVRLERLWEWETLIPKVTPLPQKSHFAIRCTSYPNRNPRNDALYRRLNMIAEIWKKCKYYFHIFSVFLKNLLLFRLRAAIITISTGKRWQHGGYLQHFAQNHGGRI